MASTHKTPALYLNKWLGADKPKRDDFNADNDKLDAAFGDLAARVTDTEGRMEPLEQHAGDGSLHVTAEEKEQWGSGGGAKIETGTYTGNGTATRTVELGFKPRFGYLFAVGYNAVDGNWNTGECYIYSGFFSAGGCSNSITVTNSGFTAEHMTTRPMNGAAVKFNQSGVTYVYVAGR